MPASSPDLRSLIVDGNWLAHRYDDRNDTIQFRFVPRERQQAATFLTDAEIGDAESATFPRQDALAEARRLTLPQPRFIFHSAYCCSTMLIRAFDLPGTAFGLSEPQILNDIVGLRLRGGDARQVAAALDAALVLLARPLSPGEVNVIKPSNLVNPLLKLFAALRPDLRAIGMYAPLETFLRSIERKEIEGRIWVRELMWKFIALGEAQRFRLSDEDLYRQTDLQVAALGWLTQYGLFADIAAILPDFRTLESERLLADRLTAMRSLSRTFDLPFDAEAVISSPAFTTHSKDRRAYSPAERREEQAERAARDQREIAIVRDWTSALAGHAGLPSALPAPLFD